MAEQTEQQLRDLVDSVTDYAIFTLDPNGLVTSWNTGAERIKGYTPDEIIGRHFSTFYPPDAVAAGWPQEELRRAARDGRFEDEGWRVRRDGTRFWANVVITALRAPDGSLRGFGKITRDLTERRRQEEALRLSEERFRLLVDGLRDYAVFMLDPVGNIVSWNAGAGAMTGYSSAEVLGRNFELMMSGDDAASGKAHAALEAARARGRFEDEGWRVRKDGALFWANTIVTALRDTSEQLIGFAMITRDLTDRRRIEMLEESERQATNFLAMLAHELRNPLAPIRNAVTVMNGPNANASTLTLARDVIDRQTLHLSRLVDDLLDVSRITTGKILLRKEPTDLSVAISRALETCKPAIAARRHTLHYAATNGALPLDGDLTRLIQVFTNLIDNAAKYTPPGGTITISVEKVDAIASVRVQDTGSGIQPSLLPRIFDLFVQGDRTLARTEGGLGVGLALARRLVQMHGGTIEAQSPGLGMGSTFTVRLPLTAAAVQADDHDVQRQAQAGGARKILVADDNRDAAQMLCAFFQMTGNAVRVAFDGPSAYAVAREFKPDVVLLDIGLPGLSGYELAAKLRAEEQFRKTVLVAVTGYGRETDRALARESGFDQHFTKPVDPTAIEDYLARQPGGAALH